MLYKIIHKMSPIQKMLIVVISVVVGIATIIWLSFSNIDTQHTISTAKELALEVKVEILSLRKHEKDYLQRSEEQYITKFKKSFQKLQGKIVLLKEVIDELGINGVDFREFDKNIENYNRYFLSLASKKRELALLKNDLNEKNREVLENEIGHSYTSGIHGKMRDSIHHTESTLVLLVEKLDRLFIKKVDSDKYETIILSIMIIIVIFYISLQVFKEIVDSFQLFKTELDGFFRYLNRESSELKLLDESSNGSVGEITKSVNEYILMTKKQLKDDEKVLQEFIKVFSKVGNGDLSSRIDVKSNNPNFELLQDISNGMIDNLDKNIQKTLYVLNHYADQDYRVEIDTKHLHKDFKFLADGVNGLKEAVVVLIRENQENANLLKSHSSNLANHADTLSKTSIHQKDSMSQSQKYFESISQNIEQGNKSIKSMGELTSHLLTSVDEGLKLVNEADVSMELIETQAKQIDKTLEIIDEIALQTSILSLNASVEAVSAGEAGKGFAVVAKEVRSLATKSTDAANQIKEIVQATSDKIATGLKVTQKLTQEFDDLSDCIHSTTKHINELSDNMHKQDNIIEDINSAMPKLQNSIDDNGCIAAKTDKIVSDIDGIVETIVKSTKKQVF